MNEVFVICIYFLALSGGTFKMDLKYNGDKVQTHRTVRAVKSNYGVLCEEIYHSKQRLNISSLSASLVDWKSPTWYENPVVAVQEITIHHFETQKHLTEFDNFLNKAMKGE